MRRTGEDEGLNENGARRSEVIYAGADEGLSKKHGDKGGVQREET